LFRDVIPSLLYRYINWDAVDVDWKPRDEVGNWAFKISGCWTQRSS